MNSLKLFAILAFVFLSGCDRSQQVANPMPTSGIKVQSYDNVVFDQGVTVIHDDSRSVTCWIYRTKEGGYSVTGGGISCLPDKAIDHKKPSPKPEA